MASIKKNTKKQDEKHLKILRDLCSLPHNKKCFDCGQRGPTYVNMTIGSFVCTSCSGILRGLNPQHRVKSISMTSFTPTEIEFLQNAGNEVCRQSWLGLWNSPNPPEPESRDELKVKDFMMQKYDRKTWYIPPSQLSPTTAKTETSNTLPERKPLKHLLGENAPPVVISQEAPPGPRQTSGGTTVPQPSKPPPTKQPVNDLLGDLGGDPFAQPAVPAGFNAFRGQPVPQSQTSGSFDVFGSPPAQQPQQFGGFNAFSGAPQQQSGGFNAFGGGQFQEQQQQQQAQGFNAFATPALQQQQQQPLQQQPPQQQQQPGGFSPFGSGTSPPRQQQAGSFNAFGSTQNQQPTTKQSSFGAFGSQQSISSSGPSFDAFGGFSSSSVSQQTKTTTALGGFGPMVSASASGAPSSVPAALSMGDKYAALSDLDSIFKAHAPTPNVGQGSMFSSSNSSNTSIGISSGTPSGMSSSVSTGMSAGMSSGPNPFASGSTLTSQSQSNPFQSSGGGMNQPNGFLGGNTGFGSNPSVPSSAQSLNFASAGMTAMAANQFSKLGGNQPGLFGSQGGTAVMQSSGFSTGQGQFGTGVPAQSTGGQFGGAQFGSSQFGGAQFASAQLGGGFLPQQQQHQQQQTFGGMVAGLPGANQFGQTTQQQQFLGGWQQESQSNPFMGGGGLPQKQSTNPFM